MERTIGCNLLNTRRDGRMPSDFTDDYYVHIIVRRGEMRFTDNKRSFVSQKGDLVISQLSSKIRQVTYSDDFEADFLVISDAFLSQFNPEMIWASKGIIFIRINPSFHLHAESLRLLDNDFEQFRYRLCQPDTPFRRECLGRVFQLFLYDLWTVYASELSQVETGYSASRIFFRFLSMVQDSCCQQRDVAYYAERLCITPKYLSQVCRNVSGMTPLQWISFYAKVEIVALLNDQSKTLAEIAGLMNFDSPSHFSRYTKKILGVSPSAYRQQ